MPKKGRNCMQMENDKDTGKPARKRPMANRAARPVDKPQVLRETDDDARRQAPHSGARRPLHGAGRSRSADRLSVRQQGTDRHRCGRRAGGPGFRPFRPYQGPSGRSALLAAGRRARQGRSARLSAHHPSVPVPRWVVRDTPEHIRIRARFLDRHPKAALYADFPDFRFFRITPQSASLNGGFGRAYNLPGLDLLIPAPGITDDWLELAENLKNMTEAADKFAAHFNTHGEKQCDSVAWIGPEST